MKKFAEESSRVASSREGSGVVDSLDLAILGNMLANGRATFKQLAEITKSDHRTVASRFQRMIRLGIIRRPTIDVDWSRIGLAATAYMGSTTALGEEDRRKLFDFMKREPRIIEAYTTIGSHEYFMKVVDWDPWGFEVGDFRTS